MAYPGKHELILAFSRRRRQPGIISIFLTGSVLTGNANRLSDIDLVVVGQDDVRLDQVRTLRSYLITTLEPVLGTSPVIFAEPSHELLLYLLNIRSDAPHVHVVYHPLSRFNKYVLRRDAIVESWRKNHLVLQGVDVFESDLCASDDKVNDNLERVDDLIQTLQNSFLVADLTTQLVFFSKTLSYLCRRLSEFEGSSARFGIGDSSLRTIVQEVMPNLVKRIGDAEWVSEMLHEVEQLLFEARQKLSALD